MSKEWLELRQLIINKKISNEKIKFIINNLQMALFNLKIESAHIESKNKERTGINVIVNYIAKNIEDIKTLESYDVELAKAVLNLDQYFNIQSNDNINDIK